MRESKSVLIQYFIATKLTNNMIIKLHNAYLKIRSLGGAQSHREVIARRQR